MKWLNKKIKRKQKTNSSIFIAQVKSCMWRRCWLLVIAGASAISIFAEYFWIHLWFHASPDESIRFLTLLLFCLCLSIRSSVVGRRSYILVITMWMLLVCEMHRLTLSVDSLFEYLIVCMSETKCAAILCFAIAIDQKFKLIILLYLFHFVSDYEIINIVIEHITTAKGENTTKIVII